MKIERLGLILVLALSGCSALVESALEGEGVVDCRRMLDGTRCGENQVCINNICESSRCGDGVVAAGEECDELDDISGDGCEPVTCQFSCTDAADCTTSDCATSSCDDNVCTFTPMSDGTTCAPPTGENGSCQMGVCVSVDCGNGSVDPGEECDSMSDGCIACEYECESNDECDDLQPCNGVETCDTPNFACVPGTAVDCDDNDDCTDDACSPMTGMCLRVLIDSDLDGYADAAVCSGSSLGGDCEPLDPDINPGAAELCDGIDNNCRDGVDENDMVLCYRDADGDSYGRGEAIPRTCECLAGEATRDGDCFDIAEKGFSINPSQRGYFDIPYCMGRLCFDYNCNRTNTPEDTSSGSCIGSAISCAYRPGWAEAPPACGESAAYVTGCGRLCNRELAARTQRCN